MANPADNLNNIADSSSRISDYTHNTWMTSDSIDSLMVQMTEFASKISDYTYNAQVSLDFIDTAVSETFDILETGIDGILIGLENIMDSSERSAGGLGDILSEMRGGSKAAVATQGPAGQDKLTKTIDDAFAEFDKKQSVGAAGGASAKVEKESGGTGGFFKALKNLGDAISGVATVIKGAYTALATIPDSFMALSKKMVSFVGAFDPGVVARFGLTLADLMATIGMGLRPIFLSMITILRTFANLLVPVMQQMAPAMRELGNALLSMAIPFLVVFANGIKQLTPIISSLSTVANEFGGWFNMLIVPIQIIIAMLALFIHGLVFSFHAIVGTVKAVVMIFISLYEAIAGFIGWILGKEKKEGKKESDKWAEGVVNNLDGMNKAAGNAMQTLKNAFAKPEQGPSTGMAARGASYAGIGDLGKNLMQAAFGSSTEKIQQDQLDQQKLGNAILNNIVGILGGNNANKNMAGVRN